MKSLSLMAGVLLAALAWGGIVMPLGAAPRDDAAAPVLEIETLADGHFSLAAQRGKWVVINYWATWCSPCIEEMPALSRFAADRDDVRVIGLDFEDAPHERIRAFLDDHPVAYPVAMVAPAEAPAGLPAPQVLPTTFVVGPDGKLVKTWVGPLDMRKLRRLVDGGETEP